MITVLTAGLTTGAIYAFIAVGYNITYLTAGALNFAHANLMVLGIFISVLGLNLGLPPLVVVLATGAFIGLVALVEERLAIRTLKNRAANSELVTTLGVATLITGVITLIWGSDPIPVPPLGPTGSFLIGNAKVLWSDLILIAIVVVISVVLIVISRRTKLGLSSLAQTEDVEAARIRGINVARLSMFGFAASGVVVGIAAIPIGHKTFALAEIALVLAIKGFVVLTLGGVGSIPGALVGGLVIGMLEAVIENYIGTAYRDIVVFVIFVAVLFIRPQGLFGVARSRIV